MCVFVLARLEFIYVCLVLSFEHSASERVSMCVWMFVSVKSSQKESEHKMQKRTMQKRMKQPERVNEQKNTTTLNCVCELLTVFVYSIYHMCPSTHIALSNALSVFISFVIPFFLTQFVVYTLISLTLTPCHPICHMHAFSVYTRQNCVENIVHYRRSQHQMLNSWINALFSVITAK